MAWESTLLWGAVGVSMVLGIGAQVQLWLSRRGFVALNAALTAELTSLRQRHERDRNAIENDLPSLIGQGRDELADLAARFERFRTSSGRDIEKLLADLDVIEESVAGCLRASRASPFSALNLQFLNDGLDDVRARLAALELAAQKAKLEQQMPKEEARPLWLVQREVPTRPAPAAALPVSTPAEAVKPEAAKQDAAKPEAPKPQLAEAVAAPAAREPGTGKAPPRKSFADWLSPTAVTINDDTPVEEEPEALPWPGSLSRIAAF